MQNRKLLLEVRAGLVAISGNFLAVIQLVVFVITRISASEVQINIQQEQYFSYRVEQQMKAVLVEELVTKQLLLAYACEQFFLVIAEQLAESISFFERFLAYLVLGFFFGSPYLFENLLSEVLVFDFLVILLDDSLVLEASALCSLLVEFSLLFAGEAISFLMLVENEYFALFDEQISLVGSNKLQAVGDFVQFLDEQEVF